MLCSVNENPFRITNIEKYKIIYSLKGDYTIEALSKTLGVSSRSFRKWCQKGKPHFNNFNSEHARIILAEHKITKGVYGILRLKNHIFQKLDINFNHKKITRYKKHLNLPTLVRKRKPITNRINRVRSKSYMAENLINCDFTSKRYGQKVSTDVSVIKCSNGRLYLSALKDLYSNKIISYSISENNNTKLVMDMLNKANTKFELIHSDQGSQYYSYEYREFLENNNIKRSMSRAGACWENSPIENWFSQLKEEQLRRIGLSDKVQTKESIKKYVQWYNTERIQKCLGYLSPVQFLSAR